MADSELDRFARTFRHDVLTVRRTDSWTVSVRPAQPVLGALVISSTRGCVDLAELTATEGAELIDLLGRYEGWARRAYGAVRLNVLLLMMKDPIVHVHVLPRYDGARDRHGATWTDAGWPGPPSLEPLDVGERALLAIADETREAFL